MSGNEYEVEVTIKATMKVKIALDAMQTDEIERHAQDLINEAAVNLDSPYLHDWQVTKITPVK